MKYTEYRNRIIKAVLMEVFGYVCIFLSLIILFEHLLLGFIGSCIGVGIIWYGNDLKKRLLYERENESHRITHSESRFD